MLAITVDDKAFRSSLDAIHRGMSDLTPVMQSIGMTTRQLKKMTRMEGIFYGLIVGVLVLTVGSGVLGAVAVVMKSRVGYFRFVYPWRELIGVLLILGGLCVAIPEGVFRRIGHPVVWVGALIRQRLGRSREELPLAKVLEGGTWAAGRRIAAEKRPGGGPPLTIVSDGTVF